MHITLPLNILNGLFAKYLTIFSVLESAHSDYGNLLICDYSVFVQCLILLSATGLYFLLLILLRPYTKQLTNTVDFLLETFSTLFFFFHFAIQFLFFNSRLVAEFSA